MSRTAEDIHAANCFHVWRQGWRDGAQRRMVNSAATGHSDPRTPRLPTMALDDATLAAIAPRPTRPTTASPPTTLAGTPEALAGLGGAAPPRSTSCHAFGDSCHDLSNVCHGTGDPR